MKVNDASSTSSCLMTCTNHPLGIIWCCLCHTAHQFLLCLCYGGMARKATMIKKIRSETKNVLLISGGDVLTGTIWYRVYRGNATRFFMNELGYDIMVSKSSTSA